MAPNLKLCQCYKCIKYTTRDPNTGSSIPGLIIKRSLWDAHQKYFLVWQKEAREREEDSDPLVEAIISTTLRPGGLDDPLVSTRSGDHRRGALDPEDAAEAITDSNQTGMLILFQSHVLA